MEEDRERVCPLLSSLICPSLPLFSGEFSREVLDALTEAQANRRLRGEELTKACDKAGLTVLTAP